MLVCAFCKKEMKCVEIGKGVRYGKSHVYPGDVYSCSRCGCTIIKTTDCATNDPNKSINTIQMD